MEGAYSSRGWDALGRGDEDPLWSPDFKPDPDKVLVEVNLLQPWGQGVLASLYYKGVNFDIEPDVRDGMLEPDEVMAIAALGNAAFATADMADTTEQALLGALIFPGTGGFCIGMQSEDEEPELTQRFWAEAVQPWEMVFDRHVRNKAAMRYIGYIKYISVEEFCSTWPEVEGFEAASSGTNQWTTIHPDLLEMDKGRAVDRDVDKVWVRVLQLCDMTTGRMGHGKKRRMRRRTFLVGGTLASPQSDPSATSIREITDQTAGKDAPIGAWFGGKALVNILPLVVDAPPSRPLYNLPPGIPLFRLNMELNILTSDIATASRRSAASLMLFLNDAVDDDTKAALLSGTIAGVKGINGNTLDIVKWVEQNGLSSILLDYRRVLQEAVPQVQLTASMTRGESGKYVSATEVQFLASYTETMIGRMRKRADEVLCTMMAAWLRLLVDGLGPKGAVDVVIDNQDPKATTPKKVVSLTSKALDRRFDIKMKDGANTPMAENQKKVEWAQLQQLLSALIEKASNMENPSEAGMARALYDYVIGLFDLPPSLRWAAVEKPEPEPEPEPEPPPMVPPPGAMPQPGMAPDPASLPPIPPDLAGGV